MRKTGRIEATRPSSRRSADATGARSAEEPASNPTLPPPRRAANPVPPNAHSRLALSTSEWERIAGRLGLSKREAQIVRYMLDEADEHDIAGRLGITVRTVRAYLGHVYLKVGAHSRSALFVRVFAEHLEGCVER